jgi:hypothetical protein
LLQFLFKNPTSEKQMLLLRTASILALVAAAVFGIVVLTTPGDKELFLSSNDQLQKFEMGSEGKASLIGWTSDGSCHVYHVKGKVSSWSHIQLAKAHQALARDIRPCKEVRRKVSADDRVGVLSGEGSIFFFTPGNQMLEWYGYFIYVLDRTYPDNYVF